MTETTPVETLRRNLADLIEESRTLRLDVKADAAARRRENLINMVLSVFGVIVIGMVLFVAYQTFQIGDQIASCTTPTGQCYQDSSKRTSGTVQKLISYNVIIAQCGRTTKTDAELEKCVTDKITQAEAKAK